MLKSTWLKNVITGVNQSGADVQIGDRRHEEICNTILEEADIFGAML